MKKLPPLVAALLVALSVIGVSQLYDVPLTYVLSTFVLCLALYWAMGNVQK